MKIDKQEIKLIGGFEKEGNKFNENKVTERINKLIENYLIKVGTDESGWNILYKAPDDGRYWELTYPNNEQHGGGAPVLTNLSENTAKEKYKI